MKDLLILLTHLLTTIAKGMGPGGAKTVVADRLLLKQQLLVMNRNRNRAPNPTALDRFLLGFWSLFLTPRRIQRAAVILRPATLLKFHRLLQQRKYRQLYSSGRNGKPGPAKGPSPELVQLIVRGDVPATLSLARLKNGFPLDWEAQRKVLGFTV